MSEKLNIFLCQMTLGFIKIWNQVTSTTTELEPYVIVGFGFLGSMGFSLQLAVLHDILFFCSINIFVIYSLFCLIY